jgi:hypothetical protein
VFLALNACLLCNKMVALARNAIKDFSKQIKTLARPINQSDAESWKISSALRIRFLFHSFPAWKSPFV